MKNLNKIITCLMLVVSISINANNINSGTKEELIDKMSNDDNVAKFLVNGLKLATYGTIVRATPEKVSNEDLAKGENAMSGILVERNNSLEKIYLDYPELNNYNNFEKKDIFMQVMNSPRTAARVTIFFSCIGGVIIGLPVCIAAGVSVYKKWAYHACYAAAVASSLAAQAADPVILVTAMDTGAEAELIEAEAIVCGEVVQLGGVAKKVTECLGLTVLAIGTCIEEFTKP